MNSVMILYFESLTISFCLVYIMLSSDDFNKWKWKRKLTMIVFVMGCFLLGMELSMTILTTWLYIKELVKPSNPIMFYSFTASSYHISAIFFSLIFSRIVDRYRNVRSTVLFANAMVIIGNIVYTWHFSPWFLVAGRFLSGAGSASKAVMAGEIARSFCKMELNSKMAIFSMAFSFGCIIAPSINVAFAHINIQIGSWHINYTNFPTLFLSMLFLIVQIMSIFMLFDLSREFDLKEMLEMTGQYDDLINDDNMDNMDAENNTDDSPLLSVQHDSLGTLDLTKALFSHYDTCLLLCYSVIIPYLITSTELWFPLVIFETMKWSLTRMNFILLVLGIVATITFLLLVLKTPSGKIMFYFVLCSVFANAVIEAIYIALSIYHKNVVFDVTMWVMYVFCFSMTVIMDDLFLVLFLSKMVSSRYQTSSEGIRRSMTRLGALFALSSSPFLFRWLEAVCSVYIGIIFIMLCLLVIRRKTISNPTIIIT